MDPDQEPRFGQIIRRGKGRQGVDLPIGEPCLRVRANQPDPIPVRLQPSKKGVPGRIKPKPAEIEMGLGGRERLGGEDCTSVGVFSTGFGGRESPPCGPGPSYKPDRHRGRHPGHPGYPVQGKSPCLSSGGYPDRVSLGNHRRFRRAEGFSRVP